MCVLYALKLWKRMGGRLLITFQPGFHVMLITNEGRIFHGTTRSHDGRWRIEEIDAEAFTRWLTKKKN